MTVDGTKRECAHGMRGEKMPLSEQGLSLRSLWRISGAVSEQSGLRRLRGRLKFVWQAVKNPTALQPFTGLAAGSALSRAIEKRPEMMGAILWPYICANWDAHTRLRHIAEHFNVIGSLGRPFDFSIDQSFELLDLADVQESLRVVLDQPRWFMREGQLVMNLFAGEARIYSIAFSFGREAGETVAYIGAIQGGNKDGVMADYKDLTKTLHGMRPRDFLVELLRSLCRTAGVTRIYAIADASRQHRSSYFGRAKLDVLSLDYDEIWTERGGVKANGDFFALAMEPALKPLEEVASKKRAMYRRRYELLESLDARIALACGRPAPVRATEQLQPAEASSESAELIGVPGTAV